MTTDYRDILELLKEEQDFIEKEDTVGLFVRHGKGNQLSRTPSPVSTMVTHIVPIRATNATLLDFVSPEHWTEAVPCHFILFKY